MAQIQIQNLQNLSPLEKDPECLFLREPPISDMWFVIKTQTDHNRSRSERHMFLLSVTMLWQDMLSVVVHCEGNIAEEHAGYVVFK